jgi:hypothetical protein
MKLQSGSTGDFIHPVRLAVGTACRLNAKNIAQAPAIYGAANFKRTGTK